MDTDDIDLILIDIIKEFTQPENLHILDSQKLASSIFFSFAVGVFKNDDDVEEKLKNLKYCMSWILDHEDILKNFKGESNE